MRLGRSTGALSGLLIILLGIWGGLIPFIGPYFDYSFGVNSTWHYTSDRLWLEILPGAVAVVGGLLLILAATSGVPARRWAAHRWASSGISSQRTARASAPRRRRRWAARLGARGRASLAAGAPGNANKAGRAAGGCAAPTIVRRRR